MYKYRLLLRLPDKHPCNPLFDCNNKLSSLALISVLRALYRITPVTITNITTKHQRLSLRTSQTPAVDSPFPAFNWPRLALTALTLFATFSDSMQWQMQKRRENESGIIFPPDLYGFVCTFTRITLRITARPERVTLFPKVTQIG